MAEKDGEDLASVLEQALAEAEARARDRQAAAPSPDQQRPNVSDAVRRAGGGMHQVDESGLPPVRRRAASEPRTVGAMLRQELPHGRLWEVAWITLREAAVLVGLFWLALIVMSFVFPDGGLGLSVLTWSVLIAAVLRLAALAVSAFRPDR